MTELIIVTIAFLLIVKGIPLIRQIDDEYIEKYNKKNKWKENITKHYNGHHQIIGYRDYKKHNYDDDEY